MTSDNITLAMLAAARDAWLSGAPMRESRARCKRFAYGNQWSEAIPWLDGASEGRRAIEAGRRPMTNNLIRQHLHNVVGPYRAITDEKGT